MAKVVVTFDELGGIAEFNGLTIGHAEMALINKAGDYLVEIFGPAFDEKIDYNAARCDWVLQLVFLETYPPSIEELREEALRAVIDKILNDPEINQVFSKLSGL